MRLADFILANIEPILAEWEVFARGIWPGAATDPLTLRDHAEDILRATASDMVSSQTSAQQSDKSRGDAQAGAHKALVDRASVVHAIGRVRSGFTLVAVVAEYRALRGSVIRLWRESSPDPDRRDLDDLTRFNESIDQSLTEAARSYSEEVERSRQMFLAILGHDLRNPLNAMMMTAGFLARRSTLDAKAAALAARIETVGEGMAEMINDLLDFTSTRLGGEMPLSPQAADVSRVCGEVVGDLQAAHPERSLRYAHPGPIIADVDVGRFRQALSNLLGNAVQHGNASEPISVAAQVEGTDVLVEIRNGGAPIPAERLATMFDPLVRDASEEANRARRPGSIGLGLYIVRSIASAHGGSVEVSSTAGQGTVFKLRLPLKAVARH